MFYFLSTQLNKIFPVTYFTWNYWEAGHGKGAPDGIGGVCTRTADVEVANGKDIVNVNILFNVLKEKCPGIWFFFC